MYLCLAREGPRVDWVQRGICQCSGRHMGNYGQYTDASTQSHSQWQTGWNTDVVNLITTFCYASCRLNQQLVLSWMMALENSQREWRDIPLLTSHLSGWLLYEVQWMILLLCIKKVKPNTLQYAFIQVPCIWCVWSSQTGPCAVVYNLVNTCH